MDSRLRGNDGWRGFWVSITRAACEGAPHLNLLPWGDPYVTLVVEGAGTHKGRPYGRDGFPRARE